MNKRLPICIPVVRNRIHHDLVGRVGLEPTTSGLANSGSGESLAIPVIAYASIGFEFLIPGRSSTIPVVSRLYPVNKR